MTRVGSGVISVPMAIRANRSSATRFFTTFDEAREFGSRAKRLLVIGREGEGSAAELLSNENTELEIVADPGTVRESLGTNEYDCIVLDMSGERRRPSPNSLSFCVSQVRRSSSTNR